MVVGRFQHCVKTAKKRRNRAENPGREGSAQRKMRSWDGGEDKPGIYINETEA